MGSIEQNYGGTKDNSPKSKLDMSNYLFISINGNETDTEANVNHHHLTFRNIQNVGVCRQSRRRNV